MATNRGVRNGNRDKPSKIRKSLVSEPVYLPADRSLVAAAMPEIRTAVMIMVDVLWQEPAGGALQTARARMEDKSAGGACIRSRKAIPAGSKLKIQWRFEQFSGVVIYCRSEAREYIIGIQRIAGDIASEPPPSTSASPPLVPTAIATATPEPPALPHFDRATAMLAPTKPKPPSEPASDEVSRLPREVPPAPLRSATLLTLPGASESEEIIRHRVNARDGPPADYREALEAPRHNQLRVERASKRNQADQERKPMVNKWLARAPWNMKPEAPAASGGRNSAYAEVKSASNAKENFMPQPTQTMERPPANSAREVPAFQVELSPMEDLYRIAGIATPSKGYSVTKLVEMINSEHIRGLSRETKRAAILMALDAAGVSLEQVQRDAKSRQNALELYEAEQKKQVEAEWSRKAEEITHIQAELESIKAHYTSRINRNMEALARDKARFNAWITTKEQESQNMTEAVELCMKPIVSEPPNVSARESASAASAASGLTAPATK